MSVFNVNAQCQFSMSMLNVSFQCQCSMSAPSQVCRTNYVTDHLFINSKQNRFKGSDIFLWPLWVIYCLLARWGKRRKSWSRDFQICSVHKHFLENIFFFFEKRFNFHFSLDNWPKDITVICCLRASQHDFRCRSPCPGLWSYWRKF